MHQNYEIILKFVDWAVVKDQRSRYHSVLGTRFGEQRFINVLHDKIVGQFLENKKVNNFSKNVWSKTCRVYCPDYEFGFKFSSMDDALSELQNTDTWLILTEDSKYAIHRGELRRDKTIYLAKNSSSSPAI